MAFIAPPNILVAARTSIGLTQSEVAAEAGISRSSLQRIELGKIRPGRNTIRLQLFYETCGIHFISPSDGRAWGIVDNADAFRTSRRVKVSDDAQEVL